MCNTRMSRDAEGAQRPADQTGSVSNAQISQVEAIYDCTKTDYQPLSLTGMALPMQPGS